MRFINVEDSQMTCQIQPRSGAFKMTSFTLDTRANTLAAVRLDGQVGGRLFS